MSHTANVTANRHLKIGGLLHQSWYFQKWCEHLLLIRISLIFSRPCSVADEPGCHSLFQLAPTSHIFIRTSVTVDAPFSFLHNDPIAVMEQLLRGEAFFGTRCHFVLPSAFALLPSFCFRSRCLAFVCWPGIESSRLTRLFSGSALVRAKTLHLPLSPVKGIVVVVNIGPQPITSLPCASPLLAVLRSGAARLTLEAAKLKELKRSFGRDSCCSECACTYTHLQCHLSALCCTSSFHVLHVRLFLPQSVPHDLGPSGEATLRLEEGVVEQQRGCTLYTKTATVWMKPPVTGHNRQQTHRFLFLVVILFLSPWLLIIFSDIQNSASCVPNGSQLEC